MKPVYILGGYQTDFARNWAKEGKHISAMMREAVQAHHLRDLQTRNHC